MCLGPLVQNYIPLLSRTSCSTSPKPVGIAFKRFVHFCLTRRWMALYSSWWITHAMKWFAAPVHQRFLVIWKSFRRVSLCTKFNMSQVTWSKSQCEVYISIIRGQRFQRSFCIWFINDVNQILQRSWPRVPPRPGIITTNCEPRDWGPNKSLKY